VDGGWRSGDQEFHDGGILEEMFELAAFIVCHEIDWLGVDSHHSSKSPRRPSGAMTLST